MDRPDQGPRLPDFILAGAPRCGTTSLYYLLASHPDVYLPEKKEQWFFYGDDVWEQGPQWYAEQFRMHGGRAMVGEATPLYYALPDAMRRMAEIVPKARILLLLREPLSRAVSHYWFNVRKGNEALSMQQAMEADLAGTRPWRLPRGALNYVSLGMYHQRMQAVLEHFPRERVHVLILEELVADVERVFGDVCAFLGIPSLPGAGLSEANADHWVSRRSKRLLYGGNPLVALAGSLLPGGLKDRLKSMRDKVAGSSRRPETPSAVTRRLEEVYGPHNAALEQWLGREIPAWRRESQ